jgi:hypothetical protein
VRTGPLRGGSTKRARELARWFRLMHWQGDDELEGLLAGQPRSARRMRRDTAPLDRVLGNIIECCYADARALAEPSRMGALEL